MGQQTSVDTTAVDLSSILEQPNPNNNIASKGFKNNIKIWSLFNNDDEEVQIEPVLFEDAVQLYKQRCYLVLVLERQYVESPKSPSQAAIQKQLQLGLRKKESLMRLSICSTEMLTPRGLEVSFASKNGNNNSVSFSLYVWNGKDAEAHVQASAVTQALALEQSLNNAKSLEALFEMGNPGATQQYITDDISVQSKKNMAPKLHLLSLFIEDESTTLSSLLHSLSAPTIVQSNNNSTEDKKLVSPHAEAAIKMPFIPKISKVASLPTQGSSRSKSITTSDRSSKRSSHDSNSSRNFLLDLSSVDRFILFNDPSPTPRTPHGSKFANMPANPQWGAAQKIQYFRHKCSKIVNGLYLGSDAIARNKEELQRHKITHIINAARVACGVYFPDDFQYLAMSLYDSGEESIIGVFFYVIDFIEKAFHSGGRVYVHCYEGVSRSSTMVISYFMWKKKLPHNVVLESVKAKREVCSPNAGFIVQLIEWEKMIKDNPVVLFRLAPVNDRYAEFGEVYPKVCNSKNIDTRTCFVLYGGKVKDILYIWIGEKSPESIHQTAEDFVKILKNYHANSSTPVVIVKEGEDTQEMQNFKELLSQKEINTKLSDANKEYKDLVFLEKPVLKTPPAPANEETVTKQETVANAYTPGELYEFNEDSEQWEALGTFDVDDLYDDKVYVLKPKENEPKTVYVWIGSEASLPDDEEEEEFGADQGKQFLEQFSLSCKVEVVTQDNEPDAFWNFFDG